ncbi:hypothetical protein DQM68_19710 (plasmid) [Leptospira mayottensis]|uniref:Uncharacterized protein n=1 Tax=Leptospira mayottensis 200901116 TaxID=1192864 RepID=A0A343URX8_9LEPT|nr:hypothetical protein [Leptospira mayottensis]AVH81551.1 hypothetical protein [Leptospira mayottensis 200901116]AXR62878.1 hypothetical protein DQM68_19710 [Leptospira mayottensis]TGN00375.1 hypothetical protein EHR03_13190 [Leptospira mayottensis]
MISESAFKTELEKFCNPHSPDYLGDPQTRTIAIQRANQGWVNALYECAKNISPVSTNANAAKAAFLGIVGIEVMTLEILQHAVSQFALTLGQGMSGYNSTPPPALLILSSSATDYDSNCSQIASKVCNWLRTGQSMLLVPPNTIEPWL